jgi:hypothetical protein
MPRFNRKDALEIKTARAVLKDPSASAEEKASAERTITRLQTERERRVEARKSAGKEPKIGDFETQEQHQEALREWWAKLDRLVADREAQKILSDPHASSYLRRKAYEKLGMTQEIEAQSDPEQASKKSKTDDGPRREDFGFRSGHDWDDFVASGKETEFQSALNKWRETAPPMDPQLAALLK